MKAFSLHCDWERAAGNTQTNPSPPHSSLALIFRAPASVTSGKLVPRYLIVKNALLRRDAAVIMHLWFNEINHLSAAGSDHGVGSGAGQQRAEPVAQFMEVEHEKREGGQQKCPCETRAQNTLMLLLLLVNKFSVLYVWVRNCFIAAASLTQNWL